MDDLIKWYLENDTYTDEERELMKTLRPELPKLDYTEDFTKLEQEYFDRMPFCNISSEDRCIRFDESGSSFINKVFDKEVDDETLVVSTTYEHGSVQKRLKEVKNLLLLNSDNDIRGYQIDKIINEAKKYKKVFLYIIGTQLSTGEITPQLFFEDVKEALVKNNIEHKILIDDVHGMFVTPRDYRIFDYVLYTAHSLVNEYEMGILISKDGDLGLKAYNWGKEYLKRLDIILGKKEKMMQFKNIMIQYLNKLIADTSTFRLYTQTANHIFAVETKGLYYTEEEYEKLDSYKIRVSEHKIANSWIRIRFQEFTRQSTERAIEGLKYLTKLINRAQMIKKMREG